MSSLKKEKVNNLEQRPQIQVVFEDENILAINKPKNLLIHGDGRHEQYTLVD